MSHRRSIEMLGALLIVAAGRPAWGLIPGGHLRRSDCLAEWRVTTHALGPSRGARTLDCEDGDPACDADGNANGQCAFDVSVCTLQSDPLVPECVAPAVLTGIRGISPGLAAPTPGSPARCGRRTPFVALLRHRRGRVLPSRHVRLRMTALAADLRDANRLLLRCIPSSTCPTPACPPSASGMFTPNDLTLRLGGAGSDLDLGWSGVAHDIGVPTDAVMHLCLDGCDTMTHSTCSAKLVTGPGTANGPMFGPPRPVLVSGVPVCVVAAYAEAASDVGTADVATGAIDTALPLLVKSYVTTAEAVCPRCVGGRCEGGANDGGGCVVDARLAPSTGTAPIDVSRDCPPADTLLATFPVTLPLTTGSTMLAGEPGKDPATACPIPAGACQCGSTCTGDACAARVRDSTSGAFVCLDRWGGVGQACCGDDTTRPCFTTPVTRTGHAGVPFPPWPGTSYPKSSGLVVAATACLPATGDHALDEAVGLPGPTALLLQASATWSIPPLDPCSSSDGAPAPY